MWSRASSRHSAVWHNHQCILGINAAAPCTSASWASTEVSESSDPGEQACCASWTQPGAVRPDHVTVSTQIFSEPCRAGARGNDKCAFSQPLFDRVATDVLLWHSGYPQHSQQIIRTGAKLGPWRQPARHVSNQIFQGSSSAPPTSAPLRHETQHGSFASLPPLHFAAGPENANVTLAPLRLASPLGSMRHPECPQAREREGICHLTGYLALSLSGSAAAGMDDEATRAHFDAARVLSDLCTGAKRLEPRNASTKLGFFSPEIKFSLKECLPNRSPDPSDVQAFSTIG